MTNAIPVSPENDIAQSSILAQLERILGSAAFAQSDRMCRFLRMVVEYSLENRAGELKEYPIALQVFDRKPSFDPRIDPIVRVEARRLRTKLGNYYEREGIDDEIRIELPKGNYAVRFSRRPVFAPVAVARVVEKPAASSSEAAVAVIPFANLSPDEENDHFSDGLTQELILGLTRVPGLRVVAWTSAAHLRGEHDFQAVGKRLNVGAVLTGSIRKAGGRVRVSAQLIDTADSSYLWTDAFDRQLRDLLQIQDEISRAIVGTLRIHLAARLSSPALRPATYNFETINLYLKGRFEWNRRIPKACAGAFGFSNRQLNSNRDSRWPGPVWLTPGRCLPITAVHLPKKVCPERNRPRCGPSNSNRRSVRHGPRSPSYTVFTSGSTRKPSSATGGGSF